MEITQENKKLLTNIGIGIAAYLFAVRPILQKFGIIKSSQEIEKEKTEAQNISEIQKNLTSRGITLTKSKAEFDQIANTIYNDLRFSAIDDNKNDAIYQIQRVKNDADILYLIKSFGKRQEYFFGFPAGNEKGLSEFITSNIDRNSINIINDNYNRKNMKFKF